MEAIEKYRKWTLENRSTARTVETVGRSLSYIIPIRMQNAELSSEALYSAATLLGVFHDYIFATNEERGKKDKTESDGAPDGETKEAPRVTEVGPEADSGVSGGGGGAGAEGAVESKSVDPEEDGEGTADVKLEFGTSRLSTIRWLLTGSASVDVVLEMLAYRMGGKSRKWTMITAIEALRAAGKLYVLLKSQNRILIGGGKITYTDPLPGADEEQPKPVPTDESPANPERWWRGSRSSIRMPLPSDVPADMKIEGDATAASKPWFLAGEVLHIVRPLVYLASRRAFGSKSWAPLALSAGVDLASWQCSNAAVVVESGKGSTSEPIPQSATMRVKFLAGLAKMFEWLLVSPRGLSDEETEELKRRKRLWALYLLRSPMWETVTMRMLSGDDKTRLGFLFSKVSSILSYYARTHFYIAGSA